MNRGMAILGCLLLLGGMKSAAAQSFGDSVAATPAAESGIRLPESVSGAAPSSVAPTAASVTPPAAETPKPQITDATMQKALTEEQTQLEKERKLDEFFIPNGGLDVLNRPTEDGSVRGNAAMVEINQDGDSRRAAKIFLYYEDFRISGALGGATTCDMRFFVLTDLDRKLVNLDVKLVWPEMTTALSFANIMPNTPTYMDYTLVGDGCYSMDKMPNIVVNRCRVRNLSAAECAGKIVWLSAQKQ